MQEYFRHLVRLMQVIKLSRNEVEYLEDKYPTLVYDEKTNNISGIINYELRYDKARNVEIKDSYEIIIDLAMISKEGLPCVRESAGRILSIAEAKKLSLFDLHLNNYNGEMCIIIPPEVKERYPNGFDLIKYIHHIEEFLYWISYFEKYDEKPWCDYLHTEMGYVQLYKRDTKKYSDCVKKYFEKRWGKISVKEFRRRMHKLIRRYDI